MQLKHAASGQSEECQASRDRPGAFEMVRQSTTRRVHVSTVEGGGNFEDLLRIVLDNQ
jgi:hypothetical protein